MKSIFSKQGKEGYTFNEALIEKATLEEKRGIGKGTNRLAAIIEPDPKKEKGYRLVAYSL